MFVNYIVLICFAVSPALSAVRNLATLSTGRGYEFTCLDGTCISAGAVCDTHWDCPDGSDEASCYSSANSNLTEASVFHERYKRQSLCGLSQWRCTDGTCIAVGGKCDGKIDCPDRSDETHSQCRIIKRSTGKCMLPPYPDHGTYVATNAPDAIPGQILVYTQLNITCEQGYGVVGDAMPYCLDGTWYIPIQKCVSFCRLVPDVSVHYYCQINGTDSYRICNQYLPLGTIVKPECNAPVYGSRDLLLSMICRSHGKWNHIIKCNPECGRVTPDAEGLLWGGTEAIRGELPWHVAIYRKPTQRRNYYEQICGGSIVSNRIVISAAHCFWNNNKHVKYPASNYAVATAKLFREWDHKNDKDAQKSEIKSIEVTPYYRGVDTNFQHDIAVLILETPFVYYTYVRPVCLDLIDLNFNNLQLQAGNFGKVAGWGLTDENGPASPVLKVAKLPFVPVLECIHIAPPGFTESITGDKICAGYRNGTAAVCKGDSGGGLSFPETERGITRYYLRGVVSTAPKPKGSQICNVYTVTTFTEIFQHKTFINQFMSTTQTCTLPPYPENGIYEVVGSHTAKPGDEVENVRLNVSCNHGHSIIGNKVVLCVLGDWSIKMPECLRSECGWEGFTGTCVRETKCLTTLAVRSPKHPICSRQGGESAMCCTDCQLVNNTDNAVFSPTSGRLYRKDGRKARDHCLQYLDKLPYQCKQDGFYRGISRILDEENNCFKQYKWAVRGELAKYTKPIVKYPYRAEMGYRVTEGYSFVSSGIIVSDKYILTAAQLVRMPEFIVVGVNNRIDSTSTRQIRQMKRFISHPEFANPSVYHNIALIETDSPFIFNENVLPACLHVEEDDAAEDTVTATWRKFPRNQLQLTDYLQPIKAKRLSEQECKAAYGPNKLLEHGFEPNQLLRHGYDHNTQICCDTKLNETEPFCLGLSGEPLMITTQFLSCVHTAIGVASFWTGDICEAGARKSVGYTRIAPYVPWIESIVWP